MKKGAFITLEGPDGSGKSTQINMLVDFLKAADIQAVVTREPGGTQIGEKIRQVVLDKTHSEMDGRTEALLYAASRAQHVAEVIKPALEQGMTVICDRFIDSSFAYQGYARGLGDSVWMINEFAVNGCLPDKTFLMKLDPYIGKRRIKDEDLDRLELEKMEFHNEVFKGYMELAARYPDRIITIDAKRSEEEIHQEITRHLGFLCESSKMERGI